MRGCRKPHRAREPHLARADAHHLAAHAAQFRKRVARGPAAAIDDDVRVAASVIAIHAEADLAASRDASARPAPPTRRADRDGLRSAKNSPLRKRPARSGSSAAMRASSTRSCAAVRAAKRSISLASRGGATTSVPCRVRRRERARPPVDRALRRARPRFAARFRPRRTARACRRRATRRCRRARATRSRSVTSRRARRASARSSGRRRPRRRRSRASTHSAAST